MAATQAKRLSDAMAERGSGRDSYPSRIRHEMVELVMTRAFAIACGYEDGSDLDRLRHDPLLAVGRCPESGAPLASQSTISRLENAPSRTEAARLAGALVDQLCAQVTPGAQEILDIDDTLLRGPRRPAARILERAPDERGFAPIHVNHVASGKPVLAILRPARTPKGTEVRTSSGT